MEVTVMFRGPPTPIIFIGLIILAVAFPQNAQSQSAIGQLEGMTGQKIGRFVFSGMRAPMRGIGEIGGRGYDADAMHHRRAAGWDGHGFAEQRSKGGPAGGGGGLNM